jgi:hypothetical protein
MHRAVDFKIHCPGLPNATRGVNGSTHVRCNAI